MYMYNLHKNDLNPFAGNYDSVND